LIRSGRLRQTRTVLVAAVVTAAVAIGSVAGIRSVVTGRRTEPATPQPPPRGNVVTTLAVGGVTIDAPRGWWLLPRTGHEARFDGATQRSVWPIFQVSNFWPGPPDGPWCPDQPGRASSFPSDGVFLYVQQDFFLGGPTVGAWPLAEGMARYAPPSSGVCAGTSPIRWLAASRVFEAFLVAGPEASPEDRRRLLAAFSGMRFGAAAPPEWRGTVPLSDWSSVLAGTVAGQTWGLQIRDTTVGPCDRLDYPEAVTADCPLYVAPGEAFTFTPEVVHLPDGPVVTFITGALSDDVSRVILRLDDGRILEPTIAGIPDEFLATYDRTRQVYAIAIEGRIPSGRVVALDARGGVISRLDVPPPFGS
jgi:hypothetical protein